MMSEFPSQSNASYSFDDMTESIEVHSSHSQQQTNMKLYTAPGLPGIPRLYLDEERKRAQVTTRLATWKSWVYAHHLTRVLRWLLNFAVGWKLWHELTYFENPIGRWFWSIILVGFFSTAVRPFLHLGIDGFLARQLFAVRTTFWFDPKAVAFKSRLYANGVVIWRTWAESLVAIRFDVQRDYDADEHDIRSDVTKNQIKQRKKGAHYLRLIVETNNQDRIAMTTRNPSMMRSITVLELDQHDTSRITMILNAAAALTQLSPAEQVTNQPGVDIDIATS